MALIPFVNTATDRDLLSSFGDVPVVRTRPEFAGAVKKITPKAKLWIDGRLDGYHHWPNNSDDWKQFMAAFPDWQRLGSTSFQEKPEKKVVERFATGLLDRCHNDGADWITVPQMPVRRAKKRNAINRQLASATGKWKMSSGYRGELVMPVILEKPLDLDRRATRKTAVDLAARCVSLSGATVLWAVAMGLDDQSGSNMLTQRRFPGAIALHRELSAELSSVSTQICGPYWALNLALWARGLATHVATGVGTGYQYQPPGLSGLRRGATRIALPPLRRTATVSPDLRQWFQEVSNSLPTSEPEAKEFTALAKKLDVYEDNFREARKQILAFYRSWHSKFAGIKPVGRPLALYQDLSSAFVLGRGRRLPALEKTGTGRRPERLAEQLMRFCLPED